MVGGRVLYTPPATPQVVSWIPGEHFYTREPVGETESIYSREFPDEFPKGDYDMVFFVNDALLVAHPFSVTE